MILVAIELRAPEAALRRQGSREAIDPDRIRRSRGDGPRVQRKAHRWPLPSAVIRECPQLRRLSIVEGLGRYGGPDRSPDATRSTPARGLARRIAEDRPAAVPLRQTEGRGTPRNGEFVAAFALFLSNYCQQTKTECFTMSGTMMDNKPLSLSSTESEVQAVTDDGTSAASSPVPASLPAPSVESRVRRESPLHAIFVGADGIYPGTRWLIYLAMAF